MPKPASKILVTGAGGFIGHHLVSFLRREGYWVRGVDIEQQVRKSISEPVAT